jgi:hypothetical protein
VSEPSPDTTPKKPLPHGKGNELVQANPKQPTPTKTNPPQPKQALQTTRKTTKTTTTTNRREIGVPSTGQPLKIIGEHHNSRKTPAISLKRRRNASNQKPKRKHILPLNNSLLRINYKKEVIQQ